MAIEKLSSAVSIDREAKVIYFSALDDESKFLIEMNKEEGYTVKNASEKPKTPRKRRSGAGVPKKEDFCKTLTEEEKKVFESKKNYISGYYAVVAMRKQNQSDKAR